MGAWKLDASGVRAPWAAALLDDDGEVIREGGHQKHDPAVRDPDLMSNARHPVSHRRRDVDTVAVDRVVYGQCSLLEVTPCDRVEAVSRLRQKHPDWSDVDIATWAGVDPDVLAVHDRVSSRYRYRWLEKRTRGVGDDDDEAQAARL